MTICRTREHFDAEALPENYNRVVYTTPSQGEKGVRKVLRQLMAISGIAIVGLAGSASAGAAAGISPTRVAGVEPAAGAVVGVAHPVVVTFNGPVYNRVAAERSISISSPDTPEGTFSWLSDTVLQWTPTEFWPAHSPISVTAGGTKTNFQTGSSVVSVADIDAHTYTVSIDGVVARRMPASMGKPGFATPQGRFTALSKERRVTFDSRTIGIPLEHPEGYLIKGEYGVRVNWGGVYVHSAPWSVGSQGYANVSHGCINLSPDNAAWYFNTVRIGDPIIIRA